MRLSDGKQQLAVPAGADEIRPIAVEVKGVLNAARM